MSDVDWEFRYQNEDTPWDKGVPHPALDILLQKIALSGSIIVPGCGRGWDLQWLARAYPDHSVTTQRAGNQQWHLDRHIGAHQWRTPPADRKTIRRQSEDGDRRDAEDPARMGIIQPCGIGLKE